METREISPGICVAGQISAQDVGTIAARGFKTLISNRPDSEEGAVPHDAIRAEAEKAGLAFHYVPVVSGAINEGDVFAMADVMEKAQRPVLAYCRSGARCMNLLALVDEMGPMRR